MFICCCTYYFFVFFNLSRYFDIVADIFNDAIFVVSFNKFWEKDV